MPNHGLQQGIVFRVARLFHNGQMTVGDNQVVQRNLHGTDVGALAAKRTSRVEVVVVLQTFH